MSKKAMKYLTLLVITVVMTLVTGDQMCSEGSDCPRDMCCKGRRGRQGFCAPLKANGEDCQIYSGIRSWGQTPWKVGECRCRDGLYCGSNDPRPWAYLGRGTCRSWNFNPVGEDEIDK